MTTLSLSIPRTHHVASAFRDEIDRIGSLFFSRHPGCWPVFSDPVFSEIVRRFVMSMRETYRQNVSNFPSIVDMSCWRVDCVDIRPVDRFRRRSENLGVCCRVPAFMVVSSHSGCRARV